MAENRPHHKAAWRLGYIAGGVTTVGVLFLGISIWAFVGNGPAVSTAPPSTPKKPVTDEYQVVKVVDEYRWLEDANDPAVRKWSEEQNRYARALLDNLPARAKIQKRLTELITSTSSRYFGLRYSGRALFALKVDPPREQPLLVALHSANDRTSERVIVDPNQLNTAGTTAIDWYVPSLDGKLVAVSLSEKGSENGSLHIFEAAAGKELPDRIPRVQYPTGGGSTTWNRDGSGLYYTRYPAEDERPPEDLHFFQQVYFHKLGTPVSEDTYAIGKEFPRIAETVLDTSDDGRYVLATVANGDGGEFAHYLLDASGKWKQLTRFEDKIKGVRLGRDGALYMLSIKDTPHRKILRMPLENPDLAKARTIVPESRFVIEDFMPTAGRLYVSDMVGGPSRIRVFDLEGHELNPVKLLPVSSVDELIPTEGDELLFDNESFLDPPAWYRLNPSTGQTERTALFTTSPISFRDTEVVREFAASKDGTKIPINIIRRKGIKLDGNNPTLLTGYGGFGISLKPSFSAARRVWLDQGGVYAIANLRGGGEFGEEWHLAGNLTKKQNVFDDFVACAKHLIETKYTRPSRLAIEGGSNGGLLMGAVLTQHPELFRAVVSHAGVYDMLRVELDPNGAFNTTEYGTVKNPEQCKALHAYSPYHHVVDGTEYPAIFMLIGENDARVNPAQSRKMIARLQAAARSKHPVLLRTSSSSGHGIGTALSEATAQRADVLAFLLDQLSVRYKAPK